jgi:hypothetical protein
MPGRPGGSVERQKFPSEGTAPDKETPVATTEQSRRRLHRELTDVMGEERATMLVDHLPPFDWTELATKRDLADAEQRLTHDMSELRTELARDMAQVRSDLSRDIAEVRAELHHEVNRLRADTAHGFGLMRNAFVGVGYRFDAVDARFVGVESRFDALATKEDLLRNVNELRIETHRDMRALTFTLFFGNALLVAVVAYLTRVAA